ncbi:MAG: tripartite tricarboxylate transporter substrate binding protein [bacterium]|nr:tripartite tricarboxylate transporter substrate binding protein [Betaproteobacteria bacterium]
MPLPLQAQGGGAEAWPSKPVRIIVPNAPSGLADITTRLVSTRLAEAIGQPVIVDNRPGAGGTIGTAAAVKAAPDGYTLLSVFDSHATNAHLFRKLPYDTLNDLAPISVLVRGPIALVVNPRVPANSLKDLLAIARSRPGMLNSGVIGPGSPARLLVEMLELTARIDVTQVPYKGAANALGDLIGGQIDAMFATPAAIFGHLKSGRVRAIAITSAKRSAILPGVPTFSETLPGFEAEVWVAMLAPVRTPVARVNRIHGDLEKVLGQADMRERLAEQGLEAVASSPAQADQWIRMQHERWGRVIRAQNIVIE